MRVLNWRLKEDSDSSGSRRADGSRFQVLGPQTGKLGWPVDVLVQGTMRASDPGQAPREPQTPRNVTDDDRHTPGEVNFH